MRDLARLAGSALTRTARLLDGLEVHTDRMRAHLDATGGLLMAESVATRLAPALGRTAAHDRIAELSRAVARDGGTLRDRLLDDDAVRQHLDIAAIDAALDPAGWLGSAEQFVDRALATYRQRRDLQALAPRRPPPHPTTDDTNPGR